MDRRLTAILSADVEGYSRLIRLDEEHTIREVKANLAAAAARVRESGGRMINTMGDGFLAEFSSVVGAVRCAVKIQKLVGVRNDALPAERRALFRIGVNQGEIVSEGGDVFGDGINLAARLQGIAEPGGIVISGRVHEDVAGKVEIGWVDIGDQTFKNIDHAVRTYHSAGANYSAIKTAANNNSSPISLVVLPFNNMSGDVEQEYFSDGISEDIITDLSKVSGLRVVPRNTAFTFKGRSLRTDQVAQELRIRYVLEGSVRKAGSRVRVSAKLVDTNDGRHLWGERYDRDLTDIFSIQDEITRAIVTELKVKLLPAERDVIGRPSTENVEAYAFCMRGRQFLLDWTKPHLFIARRMFLRAVELDPNYARAHAGIAVCECGLYEWPDTNISLDGLLKLSAKALELDPNLAKGHVAHGYALSRNQRYDEARESFERALAINANHYEAHFFYGKMLFMLSDLQPALEHFRRSAEIRPDDYVSPIHIMSAHLKLGQPVERAIWARIGVERCERSITLHPQLAGPYHRGALALAHLGDVERAMSWADCALTMDPDDLVCAYNVVCTYSLLGHVDKAIEVFERVAKQSQDMRAWFESDSDLDALRSDQRFQRLLDSQRN